MATKTKRKKIQSLMPPREIRENTKERRAWLTAKVEEINLLPNREAKIVGTGSYQEVSVWESTEVEGRLRHRGRCQFCGNSQVVDGGRMVLHGYKRPGGGFIYNECPGIPFAPLNQDKSQTEKWLADAIVNAETSRKNLEAAEQAKKEASRILHQTPEGEVEFPASYHNTPQHPNSRRYGVNKFSDDSPEMGAYRGAVKEWEIKYPLTVSYQKAERNHQAAREAEWGARQARDHFQRLIDSGIHGTPLKEEVVA